MRPGRRRLLQLLATSSLVPHLHLPDGWVDAAYASAQSPASAADSDLIASAADALSVLDFEPVAQGEASPVALGVAVDRRRRRRDHESESRRVRSLSDSRPAPGGHQQDRHVSSAVRPDVGNADLHESVGGHRTYNPEGELATARAAKAKKHLQVLSTVTTTSVEDVNAARGEPVWFQLYQRDDWGQTKELLKRVESAGCPALVFTVDLLGGRNMEQFNRVVQRNRQQCVACHLNGQPLTDLRNRPMLNKLSTASDTAARDRLADLGLRQASERHDRHEAAGEGHRDARGCGAGDSERCRRVSTSRITAAAPKTACGRRFSACLKSLPASQGARRCLVDGGVSRGDGHLQGARARSDCGWSRPAVHAGGSRRSGSRVSRWCSTSCGASCS